MDTHSRILELANNSEIENSRSKSHAKISEFTVCDVALHTENHLFILWNEVNELYTGGKRRTSMYTVDEHTPLSCWRKHRAGMTQFPLNIAITDIGWNQTQKRWLIQPKF